MMKKWYAVVYAMVVLLVGGGIVYAEGTSTIDISGVDFNTANAIALAAVILAALGVLWGIRKVVKLTNRS